LEAGAAGHSQRGQDDEGVFHGSPVTGNAVIGGFGDTLDEVSLVFVFDQRANQRERRRVDEVTDLLGLDLGFAVDQEDGGSAGRTSTGRAAADRDP
jgi:hypothetical protein